MGKRTVFKRFALLLSLFLIFTATVQSTFGFIVTQTDPLINTFKPIPTLVHDLILNKLVEHPFGEGYVIPDTVAFDFQVDLGTAYAGATLATTDGDKTADQNGILTLAAKPNTPVTVQGIEEGTTVTVTEVQKPDSGFHVKDGVAVKETTVSADGKLTVEFVNVYSPAPVQPVNVSVTGVKILEGRAWQHGDTFSFRLEQNKGEEWVTLATQTVSYDPENTAFNTFDFSSILQSLTFDAVGTYSFRLFEVAGDLEGMAYDETVNHFKVVVRDRDMDGKLEIEQVIGLQNAVVTKDTATGAFAVAVTFNNTFTPQDIPHPKDITVPITVNKTVTNTGNVTIGPENFTFVLENRTAGGKLTQLSDTRGLAVFDLTFTEQDIGETYTYKLTEVNDGKAGVTYSTAEYILQVAVTVDEENTLQAVVTCNGAVVDACVAAFENTYHGDIPTAPPTGEDTGVLLYALLASLSAVARLLLSVRKRTTKQ